VSVRKQNTKLENVSFDEGVHDFETPENVPTLIVLNDLMDYPYSTTQ
jgi:hypothetical protein